MTNNAFRKHLTLLMIDEGNIVQSAGLRQFDDRDVEVIIISDSKKLDEYFRNDLPDFLVLNLNSDEQGIEICKKIREEFHAWDLPVIAILNENKSNLVKEYYKANASDVLLPPANEFSLYWRVKNWLSATTTFENLYDKSHCLSLAQSIAQIGYWQWDLKKGEFSLTRSLYALLDIDLEKEHQTIEDFLKYVHPQDSRRVTRALNRAAANVDVTEIEHRMITFTGDVITVKQTVTPMRKRQEVKLLGVLQDVTEKKRAEEIIVSLSYYDNLTGLPNREFLQQHLNYTMEYCRRNNKIMSLISVGIDQFSRVNSSLGNYQGDRLLTLVAKRLEEVVRSSDLITLGIPFGEGEEGEGLEIENATPVLENYGSPVDEDDPDGGREPPFIGRIQGDNFHVILSDILRPVDAATVASRMQTSMEEPFDIHGQEVFLSASYGIAVFPYNGQSPEELMTNADSAQIQAKLEGRNCFRFFSQEFNEGASHRFKLEHDLRRALENEEFELYYQPKIDIQSKKLVGAEALVRWISKERGFVSPLEFIPLCEQTGLIKPLGDWVVRQAYEQSKGWIDKVDGFTVSVNVSSVQLTESFVTFVKTMMDSGQPKHKLLDIEITEGVFLENKERVSVQLGELRQSGITISIDDFGTGFSSLSYLRELPVDTLKIDRSFLIKLTEDEVSRAIVKSVLTLAQGLNLNVVAEGVEDKFQLDFLIEHGCQLVQGYLFSKPLCVSDFNKWVSDEEWKKHFS